MVKHVKLILVFGLFINFVNAQQLIDGFYKSDKNEFVFIKDDSILFRIDNSKTFKMYIIGAGKFNLNKNGRLRLADYEHSYRITSTIDTLYRKDSGLYLIALNGEGLPISFATVKIESNKHSIIKYTDKEGRLYLNPPSLKLFENHVVKIQLIILGFKANTEFFCIPDKTYLLKSRFNSDISFGIISKANKFYIQQINEKTLKVLFENTERYFERTFNNFGGNMLYQNIDK
jgi:hypothetical protein